MLAVLIQRRIQERSVYRVERTLEPMPPVYGLVEVSKGHYRIGAREDAAAMDNEMPAQIVELSSFRIARRPVTNAHWLGFMREYAYEDRTLWSEPGWSWCRKAPPHPDHWKQDESGNWYGTGVHGPFDLTADEPVTGINRFEAEAFANWICRKGGDLEGAVIQHEYQWEVSARTRVIQDAGRCWEWCANVFQPYTGYNPPGDPEARTRDFDERHYSLRGACLHTQRPLRRASFVTGACRDTDSGSVEPGWSSPRNRTDARLRLTPLPPPQRGQQPDHPGNPGVQFQPLLLLLHVPVKILSGETAR
jgi:iron(II)-dependent oxidoreductase